MPYIASIANPRLREISVLVYKPCLNDPQTFRERYRLYFYTVRYLLGRVSWLCRDAHAQQPTGDGTANVIFSNRSAMPYAEATRLCWSFAW